ncbi:hypothetical protein F2Q70_00005071 [Brassica cretica]|uniref:SURP motif domain-containing protein n=1 Tax=Brassica cretica TaxID=69181 RepID=A0A8S9IRK7_BRACR|nr:hypothetical protein F2Q70_00005071 [Brassica cretica]
MELSASTNADGFPAVPYSYEISCGFDDIESGFNPPFPVPDYLLQHLDTQDARLLASCLMALSAMLPPPRLMSSYSISNQEYRTSSFASKHGGQSEIVLRAKQGGNPTFGFLMPETISFTLTLEESARGCKTNESAEDDDSNGPEGSREAAKIAAVVRRSIKHSKNVDYSKEKRSHHHRSRNHDKHILIHQMMTITTDPDSVYASTRTRQTMSMVIDTVLVNVQRKDEKTVENESVSKSDPEDSMQN